METIEGRDDTKRVTKEPNHPVDLALAQAALQRDSRAVDELAERLRYVPRLLSAINRRRGHILDDHEIADLVQDTLALIWTKLEDYAGTAALKTWVHPFCIHVFSNALRKKLRRAAVVIADGDDRIVTALATSIEPLQHDEVHVALNRLRASQADVIRLKYFEGLTFQEIALRFDVPVDTVKTRCYRGLRTLREWLGTPPERPVS